MMTVWSSRIGRASSPTRNVRWPTPRTGTASPPRQSVDAPEPDPLVLLAGCAGIEDREEDLAIRPVADDQMSAPPEQVARPHRLVEFDRLDLRDRDPVIIPLDGQDFEDAGGQVVQVAEVLERLAVADPRDFGPLVLGLVQEQSGLLKRPLAHPDRGLQQQPHRPLGPAEEFRQSPLGEELLAGLLGPDQLPERVDPRNRLRVLLPQRVEVVVGTLQFAGETEQLGQKQPTARVGGMLPDLLQRSREGLPQFAGMKESWAFTEVGPHQMVGSWAVAVAVRAAVIRAGPEPARSSISPL